MAPLWCLPMASLQRRSEGFTLTLHLKQCSRSSRAASLQVDTIVSATGYNYDFPYLPKSTMQRSGHRLGLYKHVFPPNLEHPMLAIVGFIHGLGAIMPLAEIQARWITRVFKGEALQHLNSFKSHLLTYFSLSSSLFQDLINCLRAKL